MKRQKRKAKTSSSSRNQLLRKIPQVNELLHTSPTQDLLNDYPRRVVLDSVREVLDGIRKLPEGKLKEFDLRLELLLQKIKESVQEKVKPSLCRVINATGVVLHTGLGRAVLSQEAERAISEISRGYSNLEIDVSTGKRGDRIIHVERLLCDLTMAEAALVVNNNAAGVLLALNTLAKGCEVVVSRGQLVEIGGSFRMPEVMQASGARLVEVGTTNKTYLDDYQKAITEQTAILLHVHTSNFRMVGFTAEVEMRDLVKLGQKKGLLCISDVGSGALLDLSKYGLGYEPTVQSCIEAGMDVVTFSGDKLLGGPQAGIIVGKRTCLEQMRKNSLYRALRIDKLHLSGLGATLKLYLNEEVAIKRIPVLEMLLRPLEQIEKEAEVLRDRLKVILSSAGELAIKDGFSQIGGGALPAQNIATKLISFRPSPTPERCRAGRLTVDQLSTQLRLHNPPILSRISKDEILLDLRTLTNQDFDTITEAFHKIFEGEVI